MRWRLGGSRTARIRDRALSSAASVLADVQLRQDACRLPHVVSEQRQSRCGRQTIPGRPARTPATRPTCLRSVRSGRSMRTDAPTAGAATRGHAGWHWPRPALIRSDRRLPHSRRRRSDRVHRRRPHRRAPCRASEECARSDKSSRPSACGRSASVMLMNRKREVGQPSALGAGERF